MPMTMWCFFVSILCRGMEHGAYFYIYHHFRIIDLPWNSPLTWYIAAIFVDFCYYWGHRASHGISLIIYKQFPTISSYFSKWSMPFGPTIKRTTAMRLIRWLTSSVYLSHRNGYMQYVWVIISFVIHGFFTVCFGVVFLFTHGVGCTAHTLLGPPSVESALSILASHRGHKQNRSVRMDF